MTEQNNVMSIDDIKKAMQAALDNGNDDDLDRLQSMYTKARKEQVKAESEKFNAERGRIAHEIHVDLMAMMKGKAKAETLDRMKANLNAIASVKGKGFTFKLDNVAEGEGVTYDAVALLLGSAKGTRQGIGGGSGKTKAEYGLSLDEVFNQFKDSVGIIKALSTEGTASDLMAQADTNSRQWQVKVAVKKAAIAQGLLSPKS